MAMNFVVHEYLATLIALRSETKMADYDSDSSGANDVETNVLLGYASKTPTSDEFSQLGGHPVCYMTHTPHQKQ